MTLLVLVFLPTIVTVFNTGYKIIRAMRNPDQLEDSQRMVIETDPNFVLTMFLLVAFVLSWLPLLCLKVFEYFIPPQADADLSLVSFRLNISAPFHESIQNTTRVARLGFLPLSFHASSESRCPLHDAVLQF
ncbi:unnamed protein product [Heligmosomoides polygyrus]|uniref:G_PROTEIN_RECEP_F1_2 domain-containing protein n=1 Tax=Heligmosomoides polygyrus TaxID=6339 RepID=A0A183F5Q2_HELPZ|nr:unnamed protein product [Heligmosomoides polygyrus]